ncbi:MAG TPA: hypothetical protein VFM02_04320 [Candidatus Paceibacterota bacterium]|nr:hypothetical protein [Candidatus Paceibacterota bacterium]
MDEFTSQTPAAVMAEKLDICLDGCMKVLTKYGFVPLHFRDELKGMFCELVYCDESMAAQQKISDPRHSRRAQITQGEVDKITLECAMVFVPFYRKNFPGSVSDAWSSYRLNILRCVVVDFIGKMGYEIDDGMYSSYIPFFWSYKLWEDLARKCGLSEEEILEMRQSAKNDQQNAAFYQETY